MNLQRLSHLEETGGFVVFGVILVMVGSKVRGIVVGIGSFLIASFGAVSRSFGVGCEEFQ